MSMDISKNIVHKFRNASSLKKEDLKRKSQEGSIQERGRKQDLTVGKTASKRQRLEEEIRRDNCHIDRTLKKKNMKEKEVTPETRISDGDITSDVSKTSDITSSSCPSGPTSPKNDFDDNILVSSDVTDTDKTTLNTSDVGLKSSTTKSTYPANELDKGFDIANNTIDVDLITTKDTICSAVDQMEDEEQKSKHSPSSNNNQSDSGNKTGKSDSDSENEIIILDKDTNVVEGDKECVLQTAKSGSSSDNINEINSSLIYMDSSKTPQALDQKTTSDFTTASSDEIEAVRHNTEVSLKVQDTDSIASKESLVNINVHVQNDSGNNTDNKYFAEKSDVIPIKIGIIDEEVSVFKDIPLVQKNKKSRTIRKQEFKLDEMVLNSDEDDDELEYIIEDEPELELDYNSDAKIGEYSNKRVEDKTNHIKNPECNNSECESMDTEECGVGVEVDKSVQIEPVDQCNESTTKCRAIESTYSQDMPINDDKISKYDDIVVRAENEEENDNNIKASDHDSDNNTIQLTGSIENLKLNESKTKQLEDQEDTVISENRGINELEKMLNDALAKNEEFKKNYKFSDNTERDTKDTEVISLVDDDDDEGLKKKPAAAANCINPNCMSGEDLAKPSMFVLSYFGLKRSKGQQVCAECFNMVVKHFEDLTQLLYDKKPLLSAEYPSHKDVILLDSDEENPSDDESYLSDDTMSVIKENIDDVIAESLVKFNFDNQIRESMGILNAKLDKLEEEVRRITQRCDAEQKRVDGFRKQIYEQFNQPYKEIPEVSFEDCEIPPMPIIKSKLQNQLYNRELMSLVRKSQQQRREQWEQPRSSYSHTRKSVSASDILSQESILVQGECRNAPPPNLPPKGVMDRPKLKVGDYAFTMRVSYFSNWVPCKVIEVIPRNPSETDPSTETYRVRLENNHKKNSVRTLTGKYIAYSEPAKVQLLVGTRVIAIFQEEEDGESIEAKYYVGVIAEPPKSMNRFRYLVFFDDGYTQYCPHENIRAVVATSKNVWEDIHPEPRDFIKNYLKQYPERPMVKLSEGQVVKVEWNEEHQDFIEKYLKEYPDRPMVKFNVGQVVRVKSDDGKWWIVRVMEVDGSLVKVHFDADSRTEWIYRGSTRLGPMYQELTAAKGRQERQQGSLLRSRGFGGSTHKTDMPYVEYTRGDSDESKEDEKENPIEPVEEQPEQPPAPRSVARKSTAKKAPDPPPAPLIANAHYTRPLVSQIPEGEVKQRRLKNKLRPISFRPHQCNEACVAWTGYSLAAGNKYDPLVKPLMFGFDRFISNYKGKQSVHYRGPCGRMIRTHQEMLLYLKGTKSQLTIDLFDFDFWVNPLSEFEEGSSFFKIEDLSYGKENVQISCVNELDHGMPQYVQYMTARTPAKDVNLNLDPDFLVGCDCTDDCENRENCSCWQLTMLGKAYVPDGDLDPLFGYQYRRLPERIATGIYECNSRCKCSATCQNRVAQQPLSCRLQLFKTLKKGWGIRCLHDIPRGAFICIYAGFLLTEQEANEGGKTYGDEYLAELDYIESVENLKEGYESEVNEPSDFEDEDFSQEDTMDFECDQNPDLDEDFQYPKRGEIRFSQSLTPWTLRLRRRTRDNAETENRKSRTDDDTISISDDEGDPVRKPKTFDANIKKNEESESKYPSVRELYGPNENVYIMDAKTSGNIGRYLNHSCSPNVFVQNVFVDTHDLRFPWVAFFAGQYIPAGTELTWDYNYDVGSVPGKVLLCYCGSNNCRGRLL